MKALTAGSLFSGVGMFDLAFSLAGFDILFQVEIDTYCQKVLKKHAPLYWPNSKVHADVRGIGRHNLPSVDVLFGGFPCQDISVSGHRRGIQEGSRSGLWYEFKRVIGEMGPRVVMLENVAAILRSEGIKVISDLTEMGYDCRWGIVSAQDIGAPHLRERWWCTALSHTANQGADWRNGQQGTDDTRCRKPAFDSGVRSDDGNEMEHAQINRCSNGTVEPDIHSDTIRRDKTAGQERGIERGFSGANGQLEHTDKQRSQERDTSTSGSESRFAAWRPGTSKSPQSERDETQSRLGRIADGSPARLDGFALMSHLFPVGPDRAQPTHEAPRMAKGGTNTNKRLAALGNGGLPQIVYPIALEIRRLLESDS